MSEADQRAQLLLVEDDEVFARVVARALSQRSYDVAHAVDNPSAHQFINSRIFNMAILDLNLGGETSLELIKPLKTRNPSIQILILTGYASIATAVEAIKLGADNYLAKPADTEEILTALLGSSELGELSKANVSRMEPMSIRRLEWEHIQKVLKENNGNISATARQLKMHRRTLQRKLQKKPVAR